MNSKFDVPVSKIFLFEHKPISDFELLTLDKCLSISLYFKFLNSGFCLFKLTNFKLKFKLGVIRFRNEIDNIFLLRAILNKWLYFFFLLKFLFIKFNISDLKDGFNI